MNEKTPRAAVEHVLRLEGVFSNDPHDPGGATIYGIARNRHPSVYDRIYRLPEPERREKAIEWYMAEWWQVPGLGQLPFWVAYRYLDASINQGPAWAARHLQNACNTLISNGVLTGLRPVGVDGKLGPITREAADRVWRRYPDSLVNLQTHYQSARYIELSEGGMQRFIAGWVRRLSMPALYYMEYQGVEAPVIPIQRESILLGNAAGRKVYLTLEEAG